MRNITYREWEVQEKKFPCDGSFYDKAKFMLSYAILAPSSHNMQPWVFRIGNDRIDVFADYSRALAYSDRLNRELLKSIGCAIANLVIAAEYFGYKSYINYFPEEDIDSPVASIKFQSGKTSKNIDSLFPMITQRITNRLTYEKRQLDKKIIDEMKMLVDHKGIDLKVITDQEKIKEIAEIAKHASEFAFSDNVFKDELSAWVRPNNTKKPDGMPLSGFGIPYLLSLRADIFIKRMPNIIQAKIDYNNFIHSPAVMVLSADIDNHKAWIEAGKVYETLSLYNYSQNIATAPNAGVIEHPDSCDSLKEFLKINGFPVFLARMGYIKEKVPHTPRRSVDEVLIS